MSSQFSYELDERQIRISMQDAELGYNEGLWQKFDELAVVQSKSANSIGNYIPTINFGISRSIIVPIVFIILIGGLSAMLFSFVDFKKKESIEKEVPYLATVVEKKKPVTITKPVIKPKQIATAKTESTTVIKTPTVATVTNSTPITLIPEVKKEEPVKVAETKPKVEEVVSTIEPKKETVHPPVKKKRTRKVKTEILPTINASLNLNEAAAEPELELK